MCANKNIQKQIRIFNKALMNVFSNFIPNKNLTFHDKDQLWMNELV